MKREGIYFLACSLVLLTVISTSEALKCYEYDCWAHECNDFAEGSHIQKFAVECPEGTTACLHERGIVTSRDNQSVPPSFEKRNCWDANTDWSGGCTSGSGNRYWRVDSKLYDVQLNYDFCVCNHDLCNGNAEASGKSKAYQSMGVLLTLCLIAIGAFL